MADWLRGQSSKAPRPAPGQAPAGTDPKFAAVYELRTGAPNEAGPLAREIYAFCPDVVDQGFGCLDELLEMSEETGRAIPPHLQALVEGIDFEDEDFGLEILARDLKARRAVDLWWD